MTPEIKEALDRLRTFGTYPVERSPGTFFSDDLALLAAAVDAVAQETDRLRTLYGSFRQEVADLVYPAGGYGDGRTYDEIINRVRFVVDAGARARVEAIEECAQWLADRAKDHERIAIDRIAADRTDEMALTHKSMSDTYHYAAQNIRALLPSTEGRRDV